MNKQEIIDRVGQEKYAAASAWFRTDSVSDDYGSNSHRPPSEPSDSSIPDLPREIKDWIWESEGSLPEQLVLLFSIYDDLPCYSFLSDIAVDYPQFSEAERAFWWTQVCERLKGEDIALKKPLLYSLWCDYFESGRTVAHVWEIMVYSQHATPELMKTILTYAGPVPYSLKRYLYKELLLDSSFHSAIFVSIVRSIIDVCGSIEKEEALQILSQLQLEGTDLEDRPTIEEFLRKQD